METIQEKIQKMKLRLAETSKRFVIYDKTNRTYYVDEFNFCIEIENAYKFVSYPDFWLKRLQRFNKFSDYEIVEI